MGGGSSTQQQLDAAVAEWRAKSARAVILDHRTGNGGTIDSFESLVGFVRTKKLFGADLWRSRADDEGPKDTAEGLALLAKYEKSSEAWWAGGDSPATDVPVALLITRDGSASDYFPYAMKGAPKVRIFGPHATVGAFSSYMGLGYWMAVNYQLAAGDTIGYEGIALTGHGVRPDEVVAPKQSDLVAGKDTIAQRALAWVRAEAKP
jgi:C-terminal processing protease CtpA/Prc